MFDFDASFPAISDTIQARALAALLEFQALREGLWACPPFFPASPQERRLAREKHDHALSAAHEQLSTDLRRYCDRYGLMSLTQSPLVSPTKLGAWCRLVVQVLLALGQDTEGISCENIMAKAARSAKRILPREYLPVLPEGGHWTVSLAINSLQLLAQHCEGMLDAGSEKAKGSS